jgi:hypothetical protein
VLPIGNKIFSVNPLPRTRINMPLTPLAIKDMQPIPSSGVLLSNLFFEVNRRLSPTLWAGDSESITGDALAALLLASGAAVNINLIQRLNPRGAYSATTTYTLYDFIKLSGVNYAYVGTSPSAGNAPPNTTYWTEISEDGISGNKVWFVTAAPAASLGAVDDAAIQDDGKIYKKTAPTTWTLIFDAANTADISAAIAAHEAADSHSQYLTQAEGDARYPLLSTLSEVIDDRVGALFIAGTNTTPQYNDPLNTLQINAVGGSSGGGGASGIQYTFNSASGATAAGEIRAADLSVAGALAINATDAQGKGAADVLARLKAGAIINFAKDSTHWVRYAVTADYASGSVAVAVAQFLGAIATGDTVYLSIVSDAPSSSASAGSVLALPYQSADPSPQGGKTILFIRADGLPYARKSDGTVYPISLGASVLPIGGSSNLAEDSFADATGTLLTAHTSEIGTWLPLFGFPSLQISSNQAYAVSAASGNVQDVGATSYTINAQFSETYVAGQTIAILFRSGVGQTATPDYVFFQLADNQASFYSRIGGIFTVITIAPFVLPASSFNVSVIVTPTTIEAKVLGTTVLGPINNMVLATQTGIGLFLTNTAGYAVDNFSVV